MASADDADEIHDATLERIPLLKANAIFVRVKGAAPAQPRDYYALLYAVLEQRGRQFSTLLRLLCYNNEYILRFN